MAKSKRHQANSPWKMSLGRWKEVLVRTWTEQSEDNISLAAAGVAFYGFLALVPLLGAIVLTYGIAADLQTVLSNMKSLTSVLPGDVAKLIGDQLISIVHTSASKKGLGLIVALAVALWGARNAATSIITALNIAYEEEETRNTIRVNLLALAITAGGVVMAVLALLAITALGYLQAILPHLPALLIVLGKLLSYLVLLLGAAAGAATLYRYAPSRPEARWEWITPGSLLSSLLWLFLTLGFGFYVAHFGNYNKAYGALATVVILVTWMYLSAYVFLLGAELNSELERQTTSSSNQRGPLAAAHGWSENPTANGALKPAPAHEGSAPSVPAPDLREPSVFKSYVASRAINRADQLAGLSKVGMFSAALSTIGLSLLRKRGREGAGAMLVAGAVGLSLLKRRN